MHEAMFYKIVDGKAICQLCPNYCKIGHNTKGICGTRSLVEDKLYAENFGAISSMYIDPIEKKPLYHWRPGTEILSIGSYGCNLICPFCQNHEISMGRPNVSRISPEYIISETLSYGLDAIAYTYNEPTVFYEMVYETAVLARGEGISNVLVTNGYINKAPLRKILPLIDALNVDIKTYDPNKMKSICGGRLEVVLSNLALIQEAQCHLEITMLIVPKLNDAIDEMANFAREVYSITGDVPVHISRYFPRYQYNLPATSIELMIKMQAVIGNYFSKVHLGNVGTLN